MKWHETEHGRLCIQSYVLAEDGDLEGSLALVEKALALRPDHPFVLTYYSRVLRSLSRFDEAEAAVRAASERHEEFRVSAPAIMSKVWGEYGTLHEERGAYVKAAYCYELSAKLRPRASMFTILASVQLTFDPQSALHNAQRALGMDPDWDEAQVILAAAKRLLSEDEEQSPSDL